MDQAIECDISLELLKGWYYQPTALTIAWLEPGVSPLDESAVVRVKLYHQLAQAGEGVSGMRSLRRSLGINLLISVFIFYL